MQDEEQNKFVGSLLDERKVFAAHIGLTDSEEEENWKFYNGQFIFKVEKGLYHTLAQNIC